VSAAPAGAHAAGRLENIGDGEPASALENIGAGSAAEAAAAVMPADDANHYAQLRDARYGALYTEWWYLSVH